MAKIKQVWMLDPDTGEKPAFGLGVHYKIRQGQTVNFTVLVETDEDPNDDDVGLAPDTSVRWMIRTQAPQYDGPLYLATNPAIVYTGMPGALTPVDEAGAGIDPDPDLFGTVTGSGLYTAPGTVLFYPCIIPSVEFVAQRGDGVVNGTVLVYAISNEKPMHWRFKYPSAFFNDGTELGANVTPGWSTALIEFDGDQP